MKEGMVMAEGKMQIPPKVYSIAEERGWGGSVWIDKTSVPRYSQAGRYVYRDGLVTTAGWRGPLLFIRVAQPWREVATMRHGRRITLRYDRDHGSVITYKSGRFDFTFVDGSSAGFYVGWMPDRTLASDYFRYGVSEDRSELNAHAARAAAWVEAKVTEALLPRLRQELEEGHRVDFGALSATQTEVTCGRDSFGWNDISTLKLSAPRLSSDELRKHDVSRSEAALSLSWKTPAGTNGHASLPTSEVWNVKALQELHQMLTSPGH
jgi:hypothetical protein